MLRVVIICVLLIVVGVCVYCLINQHNQLEYQKVVLGQYQIALGLMADRAQPSAIRKIFFGGSLHEKHFPKGSLFVTTWDRQIYAIPPYGESLTVINEDEFHALIKKDIDE